MPPRNFSRVLTGIPPTALLRSMHMLKLGTTLTIVLAILATACGSSNSQNTPTNSVAVKATTPTDTSNQDVERIDKTFSDIKAARGVSEGWATEVRPGDTRGTDQIVMDLLKMENLQKELDELGPSDHVGLLQGDMRQVMIDDLRLVLRIAQRDQELSALGQFLRIAPKLDTSLEEDFGVNPKELRAEALKMAKHEMIEMRPRLRDGDGDAVGYVVAVLREWQFTPQEIGLTVQDMKSISQ